MLALVAGVLLLVWALLAWLFHLPRLSPVLPDWELAMGLVAGGAAFLLTFSPLSEGRGGLPQPPPDERDHLRSRPPI
jgi:hypothetical protein